jgi:hypothetical protein
LQITKVCRPSCPLPFSITVTGNNPKPSTFTLAQGESQPVTLGPGSFTVHESNPDSFQIFFQGDCTRVDGLFSGDATGIISAGQTLTCTIINTHH